jgi:hypothetical protein
MTSPQRTRPLGKDLLQFALTEVWAVQGSLYKRQAGLVWIFSLEWIVVIPNHVISQS